MEAHADNYAARRDVMVDREIAGRGVTDQRVLAAMRAVPRERFVAPEWSAFAYDDRPLPIEEGQTISQPYIVATMTAAAEVSPTSRVLEIGAGSGYGAAVLGCIAAEVWSIERHELLAAQARQRIGELGYDNVHIVHGDGTLGLPAEAPFDAIITTAAAPIVPEALASQLMEGGRLVIPVGSEMGRQQLMRIRRESDELVEEDLGAVRFVPLIAEPR